MFYPIKGGSVEKIQEYKCQLPPEGYGKNRLTGDLEYVGIIKGSLKKEQQKWKRLELPKDWEKRRKAEIAKQEKDPEFYDVTLEKERVQHWKYRNCGLWIMIKGKATYIPRSYYMYLQWCPLDSGYATFRDTDRRFYSVWEYCEEDPDSAGMTDIERRRMGKTYKSGAILLDRTSREKNHHAGIQSKTANDAKQVFLKTVVNFFKKWPDFFRPVFDTSKGMSPTSELRFFQTTIKGKRAEAIVDAPELESWIDWGSAEIFFYDGSKLNTYVMDEFGKCFSAGTAIKMYDGSIKKVEDVINGDRVMGDDSTPRIAYGVTSGKERMYRIIPKSGKPFECNESHILSLKWGNRDYHYCGWEYNDTINISVKEFFLLPKSAKKHLMLWKVGVEYATQEHEIDPYFLGVWLGDGSHTDSSFCNPDKEIVEYMNEQAILNGLTLKYRGRYVHHISSGKHTKGSNKLLTCLKGLNVIKNKHIPNEYLIDSMYNRLQLLAGLLDTDGFLIERNNKPSGYEIVQKREHLAYQIHDLAGSCGLKSTIKSKIATMVRADGSVYRCKVYRVHIFGELYMIPCKVERKKAIKCDFHINRRNPLRSGFRIEPIGEGEYFGFAVDKNHLFLLADYTVVHNTADISVWDRWQVVRFCMDQDGQWCGKALLTSTIEEMENGGEEAKKIWDSSDPNIRDDNNRTKSGLYRFFLPAYETTFFDEFGMPDVEKAKTYYLNQRAGLQSDPRALSSMIRKNPFSIEEAFRVDGDRCLYDSMKLNEQLDWLSWKENITERGNFEWENGERFTKVVWSKKGNGRWEMPTGFSFEGVNNVSKNNSSFIPNNNTRFSAGCDPFKYDKVKDNRRSDCAAFVYKKHDITDDFFNDTFVCRYKHRASTTGMQYEDILKMCWYFGCQCLFESNIDNWKEYFKSPAKSAVSCEGFLMKLPGEDDYGLYSDGHGKTHQLICDLTEDWIDKNIKKMVFKETIKDWLIFDIAKTTVYDESMAAGYTLIGAKRKIYRKTNEGNRDVTEYIKMYKAV